MTCKRPLGSALSLNQSNSKKNRLAACQLFQTVQVQAHDVWFRHRHLLAFQFREDSITELHVIFHFHARHPFNICSAIWCQQASPFQLLFVPSMHFAHRAKDLEPRVRRFQLFCSLVLLCTTTSSPEVTFCDTVYPRDGCNTDWFVISTRLA